MSERSATVERVVRGQLCTGCGLCAAVSDSAIIMTPSDRGYNRPIQSKPISPQVERAIATSCPGAVVAPWPDAPNVHPYWGPWRSVSTGYATDQDLRFRASSGGVVSALAIHALKSGLVDRVVHVLADPLQPTRNVMTCSTTEAEVADGAGSRYAASSPLATMDRVLADGGSVAFVGKPCDISALRQLARLDPRIDKHVPVMLSFFCAGIPSEGGANRVLSAMGVAPEDVVDFRYRGFGWPGLASATTRDGRVAQMSYEESWGSHLSKEVQFRCKICPDAVGGSADLAMADAWFGGETGYPTFEELPGRSLIVSRTTAGEQLLNRAIAAGAIEVTPLDVGQVDEMQPSQASRKRLIMARTTALLATLQPKPVTRGLLVASAAKRARRSEQMRNFLGTVRRIVVNRR